MPKRCIPITNSTLMQLNSQAARQIADVINAGHWLSITISPNGVLVSISTAPHPNSGMQAEIGKGYQDCKKDLSALVLTVAKGIQK